MPDDKPATRADLPWAEPGEDAASTRASERAPAAPALPAPADEAEGETLASSRDPADDGEATLASNRGPADDGEATLASNRGPDDGEATLASNRAPPGAEATLAGSGSPLPAASAPAPAVEAQLRDSAGAPVDGDLPGAPVHIEQANRYQVVRRFAAGGQGVIWLARDLSVGREVALKSLDAARVQTAGGSIAGAESRFLREARITGQLEHPGVAPVHDLGRRADGSVYYVQKLVRGRTLRDALRGCDGLAARLRLLPHFIDICQAIAYAHGRGVVHRDLKPENVMVGEFGETVVLDWGLAKVRGRDATHASASAAEAPAPARPASWPRFADSLRESEDSSSTREGDVIGTPLYMSPEQAAGRLSEVDEQSDVWALGAMLYELLCGRAPFAGGKVSEVIARARKGVFAKVAALEPRAPPELAAVAERAIARDRALRYPSARALAAEVEAYTIGGRVGAYDYSPWELVKKLVAKNPLASAAVAAALLVLIASSIMISRDHRRALTALAETLTLNASSAVAEQRWAQAAAWYAAARAQDERVDARFGESIAVPLAPRPLLRLGPHASPAQAVAFLGGGGPIASTASDGGLRVWDAASGKLLARAQAHRGLAPALAASATLFASGGADGRIRLWDAAGAAVAELGLPAAPGDLPVKPEKEERLSDEGTEGLPASGITALAFFPDGSGLASASLERGLELWELRSRERVGRLGEPGERPLALAFSADGKRLASGGFDGVLHVRDLDGREQWTVAAHAARLRSVAFSPDGALLATGGQDALVQLWRVGSERPLFKLELHQRAITRVAFSPDGALLASISRDGLVVLWDVASGRPVVRLDADERAGNGLAFSPDGKLLAGAFQDQVVQVWALPAERRLRGLAGHQDAIRAVAFSPDSRRLASAAQDGTVRIWDRESGRELAQLRSSANKGKVRAVAFSADGRLLATGGDGDSLELWDPQSFARLRAGPAADGVGALGFARNGLLAIGGRKGMLQLWDPATGALRAQVPTGHPAIESVAFSSDDARLASSGNDGFVKIWDAATLAPVASLKAHTEAGRGVAFSPDGALLASGGSDRRLMVYETRGWTLARELGGHRGRIHGVVFSPDGRWLATSCNDHWLRIFDAATGLPVFAVARHAGAVMDLDWSPDGRTLATGSSDRTLELLGVEGAGEAPPPAQALPALLRAQWLRLVGQRVEPVPPEKRGRQ